MPSRWSTTVSKHGKLSRGRVAHMWRRKDVHAALVRKSNAGRKRRSCLRCKSKGKEWRKPKPAPTCVHTHTLSDPTEVLQPGFFCSAYTGSVRWRFQLPNIGTHVRAGRRPLALRWPMVTAPKVQSYPLLPQTRPPLDICWRMSCGHHMSKHVAAFHRKTHLSSSGKQDIMADTGPHGRANGWGQGRRITTRGSEGLRSF